MPRETLTSALLRRRPTLLASLAVAAVSAGLIGCGSSTTSAPPAKTTAPTKSSLEGLTADQLLARTTAAAKSATSTHIKGEGASGGTPLKLDMHLVRGKGGAGTIETAGVKIEIIVAGEDVWLRGDDTFNKGFLGPKYTPDVAKQVSGKYLKGKKADSQLADLASLADLETFVEQSLKPEGKIARVPGKPVGGVATVGLSDDANGGAHLYIADDGTDLPILIEQGGTTDSGSLSLSEWGAKFDVTAPPADQVVEISAFA